MEQVLITAVGVGMATIIGAVIGFIFKRITHKFADIVLSFAAGIMLAASVIGLVLPSVELGGDGVKGLIFAIVGIFAGAVCLNLMDKLIPHLHRLAGTDNETHNNANLNKVLLFVLAIAIHNLPEGIAAVVLPFALSFAGGTMLYVVSDEMLNETHAHGSERGATYAMLVGFCVMLVLDVLLG